ncbi:unnamed protein product [Gordionus sp. m RMFG-2023]
MKKIFILLAILYFTIFNDCDTTGDVKGRKDDSQTKIKSQIKISEYFSAETPRPLPQTSHPLVWTTNSIIDVHTKTGKIKPRIKISEYFSAGTLRPVLETTLSYQLATAKPTINLTKSKATKKVTVTKAKTKKVIKRIRVKGKSRRRTTILPTIITPIHFKEVTKITDTFAHVKGISKEEYLDMNKNTEFETNIEGGVYSNFSGSSIHSESIEIRTETKVVDERGDQIFKALKTNVASDTDMAKQFTLAQISGEPDPSITTKLFDVMTPSVPTNDDLDDSSIIKTVYTGLEEDASIESKTETKVVDERQDQIFKALKTNVASDADTVKQFTLAQISGEPDPSITTKLSDDASTALPANNDFDDSSIIKTVYTGEEEDASIESKTETKVVDEREDQIFKALKTNVASDADTVKQFTLAQISGEPDPSITTKLSDEATTALPANDDFDDSSIIKTVYTGEEEDASIDENIEKLEELTESGQDNNDAQDGGKSGEEETSIVGRDEELEDNSGSSFVKIDNKKFSKSFDEKFIKNKHDMGDEKVEIMEESGTGKVPLILDSKKMTKDNKVIVNDNKDEYVIKGLKLTKVAKYLEKDGTEVEKRIYEGTGPRGEIIVKKEIVRKMISSNFGSKDEHVLKAGDGQSYNYEHRIEEKKTYSQNQAGEEAFVPSQKEIASGEMTHSETSKGKKGRMMASPVAHSKLRNITTHSKLLARRTKWTASKKLTVHDKSSCASCRKVEAHHTSDDSNLDFEDYQVIFPSYDVDSNIEVLEDITEDHLTGGSENIYNPGIDEVKVMGLTHSVIKPESPRGKHRVLEQTAGKGSRNKRSNRYRPARHDSHSDNRHYQRRKMDEMDIYLPAGKYVELNNPHHEYMNYDPTPTTYFRKPLPTFDYYITSNLRHHPPKTSAHTKKVDTHHGSTHITKPRHTTHVTKSRHATPTRSHTTKRAETTKSSTTHKALANKKISLKKVRCGKIYLAGDTDSEDNENYENNTGRIVGGEEARAGEWPWLVSLRYTGLHACAGTIISPIHILSATHCFPGFVDVKNFTIVAGTHVKNSRNLPLEQVRSIKTLVKHPHFDRESKYDNDISLLIIDKPLVFGEYVQPACVPRSGEIVPPSTEDCCIAGFGDTKDTSQEIFLNEVCIPMMSPKLCNSTDYYNGRLTRTMTCAGYEQGGKDACKGDSGGPLICDVNGYSKLFGIVSWGEGCARDKRPGLYTNVSLFYDWIVQNL